MKLVIDADACTGHGRCYTLAPDVFAPDDAGYSELVVEGDVPAELEAASRRAVTNCPERALAILD